MSRVTLEPSTLRSLRLWRSKGYAPVYLGNPLLEQRSVAILGIGVIGTRRCVITQSSTFVNSTMIQLTLAMFLELDETNCGRFLCNPSGMSSLMTVSIGMLARRSNNRRFPSSGHQS